MTTTRPPIDFYVLYQWACWWCDSPELGVPGTYGDEESYAEAQAAIAAHLRDAHAYVGEPEHLDPNSPAGRDHALIDAARTSA